MDSGCHDEDKDKEQSKPLYQTFDLLILHPLLDNDNQGPNSNGWSQRPAGKNSPLFLKCEILGRLLW